jgi:hypothetical protein
MGMHRSANPMGKWVAAIVMIHFAVTAVHGLAHAEAHVPLSPAANLFVFGVILAGPLIGLIMIRRTPRAGAWLIAASMAAAFVFGFVNHFIVASPDHIAHVDLRWRTLFAATAVLLAITEVLGAGLAIRWLKLRGQQ